MKKSITFTIVAILLCLSLTIVNVQSTKAIAKAVGLNYTQMTIKKGKTKTLKMTVGGSKAKAKGWKSSNKKIATVSKKGVVKGKKKGSVTITCKTGFGYNLTCKVKVK